MEPIRGFTLTQPWATLVAVGAKSIETRSWPSTYRGWLAIHAAKGFPAWARDYADSDPVFRAALAPHGFAASADLPLGAVIAVVRMEGCYRTGIGHEYEPARDAPEYRFGDYSPGRYMWRLTDVTRLPWAISCKGALGLWLLPADTLASVRAAYREATTTEELAK